MPDLEGDGVILGPTGPRNTTTKGYIATKGPINRQGGLGLPSFNPEPEGEAPKELTGMDERIRAALGYGEVNTRE
jgi:hypothetical protein